MRTRLRDPKVFLPVAVVLGAIAWLAFGYFGVHLLFVDDRVDEPPPVFADVALPSSAAPATRVPTTTVVVLVPSGSAAPTSGVTTTTSTMSTSSATLPASVPESPGSSAPPAVTAEFVGVFESRAHPTSGNAVVLGNGTGQRFLRFESFETDNGPDLNVYLVNSAAGGVNDFVDLGNLKGNIGDQNYEVPPDVDLTVYDTVLIWCVRFSSAFGQAPLAPA